MVGTPPRSRKALRRQKKWTGSSREPSASESVVVPARGSTASSESVVVPARGSTAFPGPRTTDSLVVLPPCSRRVRSRSLAVMVSVMGSSSGRDGALLAAAPDPLPRAGERMETLNLLRKWKAGGGNPNAVSLGGGGSSSRPAETPPLESGVSLNKASPASVLQLQDKENVVLAAESLKLSGTNQELLVQHRTTSGRENIIEGAHLTEALAQQLAAKLEELGLAAEKAGVDQEAMREQMGAAGKKLAMMEHLQYGACRFVVDVCK